MASEYHASNSPMDSSSEQEPNNSLLETAETLIWGLLDGQLSESNCQQLEQLILDHDLVRQRYLECMQLHMDLHTLYDQQVKPPATPPLNSPILGMLDGPLSGGIPNAEAGPPCG